MRVVYLAEPNDVETKKLREDGEDQYASAYNRTLLSFETDQFFLQISLAYCMRELSFSLRTWLNKQTQNQLRKHTQENRVHSDPE